MPRYFAQHAYTSTHDGQRLGPWIAGDEVEIDADVAAFVEADSPGALAAVKGAPRPPRSSGKGKDA